MALIKCSKCGQLISEYAFQCPKCKTKRMPTLEEEILTPEDYKVISISNEKINNMYCVFGLIFGVLSAFLYFLIIFPLIALIASIIGLTGYNEKINKNKWMGIVGLILGILFIFQIFAKAFIATQ